MSLSRFAGYFLALTALATFAFASCLMGQAAPEESAANEAMKRAIADQEIVRRTDFLLHQMRARHPHSSHDSSRARMAYSLATP